MQLKMATEHDCQPIGLEIIEVIRSTKKDVIKITEDPEEVINKIVDKMEVANNLIREKYSLLKEKRHLHKELDSLSEGESKARKVLSVAENKKKQFEEYEKKEEIKEKRDKSVQEFLSFMDSVGFRVEFISVNEKELEAKLRENKISELEGKFKFIFTRINPVEHSRPYHVLVDIQNKRINVNFVDLAGDSTKLASEVEQTVNSYESIDFRLLIWLLRRKIKDAVMSTLNEKENH